MTQSPGAGGGARSHRSDRREHSSTFQPGARRRRLPGTRVRSAFITYGRERALVPQGLGDVGTRRVSVAQVGEGGCAFRGGSGSPPQDGRLSQTARLQGSHFPGAVWTLGGFQPYFLPRPGPLFSQRHFPNSRHYYFIQVTLVLARRAARSREETPRTKWAREGKEVGAAAPPCKKIRETPRTPPPSPSRLITHPTSSPFPAKPRAGSSPHSPLDVPLNKTIESKTRKPRLVLEPSIYPFATWIPIFQECQAAKPEPTILSR